LLPGPTAATMKQVMNSGTGEGGGLRAATKRDARVSDAIGDAVARLDAIAELAEHAERMAVAEAKALLDGGNGDPCLGIGSDLMAGVAERVDALRREADGIARLLRQADVGLRPRAQTAGSEAVSGAPAPKFRARHVEPPEDRGLRLIATQMLAEGDGRMEIATALKRRFGLSDPVAVADELISSIGTATS
jgi:hypothetical protein